MLIYDQPYDVIRVWDSDDPQSQTLFESGTTWQVGSQPPSIFVEGVAGGDVDLLLSLVDVGANRPLADVVHFRVSE